MNIKQKNTILIFTTAKILNLIKTYSISINKSSLPVKLNIALKKNGQKSNK
jgi:hypothetical protein